MLPYQEIWGKQHGLEARYPLALHLRDSAAAALVLWDVWLRDGLRELLAESLGARARDVTAYIVGSHDVGKANSVFAGQHARYRRGTLAPTWVTDVRRELNLLGLRNEVRHPRSKILQRHEQSSAYFLDERIQDGNGTAAEHWHSLAVLGHHGVFDFSLSDVLDTPDLKDGAWGVAREAFLEDLREGLDLEESEPSNEVNPVVAVLLAGLIVLADRLASQADSVKESQAAMANGTLDSGDPRTWIEHQYSHFVDVVKKQVGVYSPISNPVEKILGGREARPLQREALKVADGLWFAMAATGSGKTEAALLRHSTADERLLFLLPTQATTNAMMNRIRSLYEGTPNIASLAHGLSSTNDFYRVPLESAPDGELTNGLFPSKFLEHGSARLLAPVSVATVDQAIMASLPLKWTPLRLLALANAHVVIDEAHTMDPYQTRLAESLLWWLGRTNSRVTVLTATLPKWQRDVLSNSYSGVPLDNDVPVKFPSSEVVGKQGRYVEEVSMAPYQIRFELEQASESESGHLIWTREQRNQFPNARIGVLVNQISRAQIIANGLAAEGENILALHSRMTAGHRRLVERRLEFILGPNGKSEPIVVVGTQAMEASLDIDFDLFSTDLAPSPSLVQRAGRVWRRTDPSRSVRIPGVELPIVRVLRGSNPAASLPYLPSEVDRAWRFLHDHEIMTFPRDLQRFVEAGVFNLELSLDEMDENGLVELVNIASKRRKAEQNRNNLATILAPETTIDGFCSLTRFASRKDKDTDEEFPTTRLIETESRRVVVLGNPDEVPGAWDRSLESLQKVTGKERDIATKALDAVLPVSGKLLGAIKEHGIALSIDRGPLKGALAIEVGQEFQYTRLAGLELR